MDRQTILVVGGSGFIGQHLTRALFARGHDVYATHTPHRSAPPIPGVQWLACDLKSANASRCWPSACHTVVYLAQARERRIFPQKAQAVFDVNVGGLFQSVEYAGRVNAERFLYASTGSVYPNSPCPAQENSSIDVSAARSFYAASKLAAEALLGPYSQILSLGIFRLFMPYGPGQNPDMLFPQLIDKVRCGRPIQLHGKDGLRANPVAVTEVVEVFLRCLDLRATVTMNVAGPEILSLRQIGDTMGRVLGRQVRFDLLEDEKPPSFIGDTKVLNQVLGWKPHIGFEHGLREWFFEKCTSLAG